MAKTKVKYVCTNCGNESLRWLGKCPECESWNTFQEEIVETAKQKNNVFTKASLPKKINEISSFEEERILTKIEEFDRVLGGGLISGSVVLIAGDPGIGKSTLVLQAAAKINKTVLYVSGEESAQQIKLRASRLKINSDSLLILAETDLHTILHVIKNENPKVVIIDSIQTMVNANFENSAGTVTQIRECTATLLERAKQDNFSVIIVGHVTKDGTIAGPKILEHIVDTVIQFEGDVKNSYRILRAIKNRFGSTNEIGIFEMHDTGLVEVTNPSKVFLGDRETLISGNVVTASIEGTRPLLIEVQALVTPSHFGNPQRVTTGFDYRRLSILLAVLEKRANIRVSAHNVFLNLAGGVKIDEPAIDLAVCCAIASNLTDKIADPNSVVVGEVGLGGELRSISQIEKRIVESEKLGFSRIFIPSANKKLLRLKTSIKVIGIGNLAEALTFLLS
ncbi:MAG: DNA repair protein RadA [Ignavibacteriaceae bacterium]|nr:DNA repair protein RadA [Ignavibacteriaceae bacterium]